MHFSKRKEITDDYGNKIVMFFNENFVNEIIPLMSSYTHHKVSRVVEDNRRAIVINGIVSIKKTLALLQRNYKFNVVKFVEYGQTRGKDWDYMMASEYEQNKDIIPKPKPKLINLKKRKSYVI